MADDGYTAWYQAKLWQLLPGIYRALDDGVPDATAMDGAGPLQELLNRFGAQIATIRRSIDRLWENQSIETCDDWVVPYIGDLLATRLVASLDARAQRLDVANTIYYRRRAGTLGLLEELAGEITGRDARAVEFFRRLTRARHQFDPPIGNAFAAVAPGWAVSTTYATGAKVVNAGNVYQCIAGGISAGSGSGPAGTGSDIADGGVIWSFLDPAGALVPAVIEGLAGANSRTPAGGYADLRNAYAAAGSGGAFDEFSHRADLRRGGQSSGWHNISHLGVFIWWLQSFPIIGATPVSNGAAEPCYSFDPSGRERTLLAAGGAAARAAGDDWVSPDEYQLPVPIRDVLWASYPDQLYGGAFWVASGGGPAPPTVARDQLRVDPARGLFSFLAAAPTGGLFSNYHFGQIARIGAGGFPPGLLPPLDNQPANIITAQNGGDFTAAVAAVSVPTMLSILDTQTYPVPAGTLELSADLWLCAADANRPMLRQPGGGGTWTINGNGQNLVLQGVWLQGADLVLTGNFSSVTLRFVTLDPGSTGESGALTGTAIDGMALSATNLWVEASINTLLLQSCITGPIRTRLAGAIEQLTGFDSIIQCIPTGGTDEALFAEIGTVALTRCTVLGRAVVHRMQADTCILDDLATAADSQHGCVRFSAYAQGSALHAPYHSVAVPPAGPLFVSRRFGDPGYARLRRCADAAIINPRTGDSIVAGAENGAEMGANSAEGITLKKRGLQIKFEEYAPLGIYPVWIDAD